MDPISLIVAAVAAGASSALKDTAATAVKDAYGALKRLISDRHGVDVESVERKPESAAKQESLKEDLGDTGAGADRDVLAAAKAVIDEVAQHDAEAAKAVGVDLDDVTAEFIRISNIGVTGPGAGVEMDRVHARGGIVVEGVNVDARESPAGP